MITMDIIYKQLEIYNPKLLHDGNQGEITGVKLWSNNMVPENNIIYICRKSGLKNIVSDTNLLVVNDCSPDIKLDYDKAAGAIEIDGRDCDFNDVFNNVQDIFISNTKLISSSAELMDSLIAGKGLQYIVRMGAKILKKAVILIDSSFNILACSDIEYINEPLWMGYIEKGYCSYEFITEIKRMKTTEKLAQSDEPIIITCYASDIRKMVSKVVIDGLIVGHVVVLENDHMFSQRDYELSVLLCNVISAEMKKNDIFKNMKGVMYESLLVDLLKNKITREEVAAERIKSADCSFGGNLYVLCVQILERRSDSHFVSYIRDRLSRVFLNSKSIFYYDNVIILLDLKQGTFLSDSTISEIDSIMTENHLICGFSKSFSEILKFREHYEQSLMAINFGKVLYRDEHTFYYRDMDIYQMLYTIAQKENLMDLCHPGVIKLAQYDRDNNTRYYETLYNYLRFRCSIQEAADYMYIHRNTMTYRINKIMEIIESDLKDAETVFRIYFTYKIMRYAECFGVNKA